MSDELAGKSILLVDDDRDILSAMTTALEEVGADINTATDGNTAVELVEKLKPDLLVLDMMLPKRSGFLVMENIRRGKDKDDPPMVIMITGNLGTRHKLYAESLGVKAYINKPFRMEKLLGVIRDLLA
ncbi:MAG: response regulator [Planctomycetes bacterium]|nr:response regulator [Planctomycetota bacterium]